MSRKAHSMMDNLTWEDSRSNWAASVGPGNKDDTPIYHFIRAVFEGVALLVIMIGIETLFFGPGTYATLDVHPFWIAVLLVTLQHGLYSGVITAVLAAMMLDWPIRPPGLGITDYYLELARLPVQWITAAMLLGVYRQSQIRLDAERVREIAHLKAVNECFAEEVAKLDEELWQFEITVAVSPNVGAESVNTVPAKFSAIEALVRLAALRAAGPAEVGRRFAASTAALLGDMPVRLFRCNQNGGFVDVSPGPSLPGFGSEVHPEHPAVRGALTPEKINSQALRVGKRVVIALRPAPGASLCGLVIAECPSRSEIASAQAEGLRLLAAAATAALCAVNTPAITEKLTCRRSIDG
jgi:hypothetical protein